MFAPSAITLHDGRELLLRAVRPGDESLLQAFIAELSIESRYRRFLLGLRALPGDLLRRMLDADQSRDLAIVALSIDDGNCTVAGLAQYASAAANVADVAIVVGEHWRRCGLGSRMLQELERVAADAGIVGASADILRENDAAIHLAGKLGGRVDVAPGTAYAVRVFKPIATQATPGAGRIA